MDATRQALECVRRARAVAALTGAGVSAESGVPTFRGDGGLWRQFRPEELATPAAFARDPKLVWEWYDWRRGLIARARPNPAHFALAALDAAKPRFTLITQNVDGLHDLAGSRNILKLHGDIWLLRCAACGREWTDRRVPLPELPPRCSCGGTARPGVVWFGEALPQGAIERAERAVASADVLLAAGTSAAVFPAAGLIPLAAAAGVPIVEINPEATPFSGLAVCCLRAPAAMALPGLVESPLGP